jgi:hypothetical protein
MGKKDDVFYDYYTDLYNTLYKEKKRIYIDLVTKLNNLVILEINNDNIFISSVYFTESGVIRVRNKSLFNDFSEGFRLKVYEKIKANDFQFIEFDITFQDIKNLLENEKGSIKVKLSYEDYHISLKRELRSYKGIKHDCFEIKKVNGSVREISIVKNCENYERDFNNSKPLFFKFLIELKNDRFI